MAKPPNSSKRVAEVFCRNCCGTVSNPDAGLPYGWYQVTVGVPPFMESVVGRGYAWVGVFCGALCLTAYTPQIQSQETLARHAYEAAMPS